MSEQNEEPIFDNITRIWIVEDNARLRRYLVKYLSEPEDLHCTGNFSNCEDALEALEACPPPQVLLIDLGLPGMSGSKGITEFKRKCPEIEALVLTVSNEREKVFEAIAAGASGYLLKNAAIDEIEEACRKLARGESSLDGAIARMMLGTFQEKKSKSSDHGLTDREFEVLNHLAEGLYGKEIADKLGISTATVNFHCGNLYKKLHVQSQRSAILEAKKRGIL
ncbi:MAG: LuxR C-terminal-related transcriptional regulator [Roseibacillus sp.]